MTEPVRDAAAPAADAAARPAADAAAASPGALLRRWREAQGLHVAMLAASLKVPPRRLEALEADRWSELPDPAFTRALAQSVCRVLKRDPAPVLALLPRPDGSRLEQVAAGVNAPFRERPGVIEPGMGQALRRPAVWVVVALLVAALVVMFWPARLDDVPLPAPVGVEGGAGGQRGQEPGRAAADGAARDSVARGAPDSAAAEAPPPPAPPPLADAPAARGAPAATSAGTGSAAAAGEPVSAAPAVVPAGAPVGQPEAVSQAVLALRASAPSWIEARDAGGRVVFSRTLQPGESVSLDAALPLRLTIGNAAATELSVHGRPFDLAPHLRGNVARVDLP